LKEKVAAPVYKGENTAIGIRYANHVAPSISKKLALTSPTSGCRSVGIIRSRTEARSFFKWKGDFSLGNMTLMNNAYNILCGTPHLISLEEIEAQKIKRDETLNSSALSHGYTLEVSIQIDSYQM
jgi:hypothetical protein